MRLNVNHTDRITWLCRPENLTDNVRKLESLTALSFAGPYESDGIEFHLNVGAGYRIMSPLVGSDTEQSRRLRAHLETRGEGVYDLYFGVPDVHSACERARLSGFAPGVIDDHTGAPWAQGIANLKECYVGEVIGTRFHFTEAEYSSALFSPDGVLPGTTRNRNRFDHIAWAIRPENVDLYLRQLSALGGGPLDGPYDRVEYGVRASLSWATGLEIIAPIPGNPSPFAQLLRDAIAARGECVFAVVFGILDMAAAMDRARDAGFTPAEIIYADIDAPWQGKTVKFEESFVCDFLGAFFVFGEIEYPETVFVTRRPSEEEAASAARVTEFDQAGA